MYAEACLVRKAFPLARSQIVLGEKCAQVNSCLGSCCSCRVLRRDRFFAGLMTMHTMPVLSSQSLVVNELAINRLCPSIFR